MNAGCALPNAGSYPLHAKPRTRVLLVSAIDEDRLQLSQILGGVMWEVDRVGTCHEAEREIRRSRPPIVITDVGLLDGDWTCIHKLVKSVKPCAHLIVLSSRTDSQLWFEARQSGAHDVLVKPLQDADVVKMLMAALDDWKTRTVAR